MWKLNCLFGLRTSASNSSNNYETTILHLNYECYQTIFSYLNLLEDKLNFARSHETFGQVFALEASLSYSKINTKMLKKISDWQYLLQLCGVTVMDCEMSCGHWDDYEGFIAPFIDLLKTHCPNLHHLHVIFIKQQQINSNEVNYFDVLKALHILQSVKNLSLSYSDAGKLQYLQNYTQLESLHLDGIDSTYTPENFVQIFRSMNILQTLSLVFVSRSYRLSQQLPLLAAYCPMLQHLTLNNFDMNQSELGDFMHLKSLSLSCQRNFVLNINFFRSLTTNYANSLQLLQLKQIRVGPAEMSCIVKLKKLQVLEVACCAVDQLTLLTDLECLMLSGLEGYCNNRLLLALIERCTKLHHLKLGKHWPIDEKFVMEFQSMLKNMSKETPFLLTLEQKPSVELQKKFEIVQLRHLLRLDWQHKPCKHCFKAGLDSTYSF